MSTITSRPVAFQGSEEERQANRASHWFFSDDPEEGQRCGGCDCRPSNVAADYPCGQEPPRENVSFEDDELPGGAVQHEERTRSYLRLLEEVAS